MTTRLTKWVVLALVTLATAAAASEAQLDAAATPAAPEPVYVRVTLKDGQVLRGQKLPGPHGQVVLKLGAGQVALTQDQVASIEEEQNVTITESGEVWRADPNRTRYFYAPSAMMLRRGEVTLSQKELLFTAVGVGATDWLSLQVGSVLPAIFVGSQGFNLIGAVKVGGSLNEHTHLAGGAQILALPFAGGPSGGLGVGFLFGAFTWGTPDTHFTFAAGTPFAIGNGATGLGELLFTVNGNLRVSNNVALMTENWVMPMVAQGDFGMANAMGVRLLGDHLAVDLGGIWLSSSQGLVTGIPVPWVDFTWNF